MKECIFLFVFIFFCCTLAFAQKKENNSGGLGLKTNNESFRGSKEGRLTAGTCKNVIEDLQESQENDSIAIDVFKKEYEITNMRREQREWLLKKNYSQIIRYFMRKENEKYRCKLTHFKQYDSYPLLKGGD